MFKTLGAFLFGAIVAASISTAIAATGVAPPSNGFVVPDAAWLNGLAAGQNVTYQNGITAAGSTQAGATQLPSGISLIEVDTAASSTGVALPPAYKGTEISLYNNGASTLTVYPNVNNNPITAAQDTINNSTSTTATTHTSLYFFCAKDGVWAAK